jgi:hypothetical protein
MNYPVPSVYGKNETAYQAKSLTAGRNETVYQTQTLTTPDHGGQEETIPRP